MSALEQNPRYQQIPADSLGDKNFSPALAEAENRLRSKVREEFEQGGKSSERKGFAKCEKLEGTDLSYDWSFFRQDLSWQKSNVAGVATGTTHGSPSRGHGQDRAQ